MKDRNNRFVGSDWYPFQLFEVCRGLGIILRGGIDKCAGGGYEAWFAESHSSIKERHGCKAKTYPKQGHVTWARQFMTLRRFKQFLAAFRVEFDATGEMRKQDKACQLRRMCQKISSTAKKVFTPGRWL